MSTIKIINSIKVNYTDTEKLLKIDSNGDLVYVDQYSNTNIVSNTNNHSSGTDTILDLTASFDGMVSIMAKLSFNGGYYGTSYAYLKVDDVTVDTSYHSVAYGDGASYHTNYTLCHQMELIGSHTIEVVVVSSINLTGLSHKLMTW